MIAAFNVMLFSFLKQQNVVALIQGTLPNKAKERPGETNEKWKNGNMDGATLMKRKVEEARAIVRACEKNLIPYCEYSSEVIL